MEPPLQVFVSSLIPELVEERQALRQAITGLSIIKPWIFESTPASTLTLEESYLQKVRTCDFFVLLVNENLSPAIEREYHEAIHYQRPILAILKKANEDQDQLRSSTAKTLVEHIPTKWTTFRDSTDLAIKVRNVIADEIIRRVRDEQINMSQAQVQHLERINKTLTTAIQNLPPRRFTHLIGREEEISTILRTCATPILPRNQ